MNLTNEMGNPEREKDTKYQFVLKIIKYYLFLHDPGDSVWLVDCGEGSQIQLMKSKVKPGKINKFFITHLHGDHSFGLPGLMCTISQHNQRAEPVEVYGPLGLRTFLRTSLGLSTSDLGFEYIVHELEPIASQVAVAPEWSASCKFEASPLPSEKPGSVIQCDENQVGTNDLC